jgi:hypothetical protein
MGLRLSIVSGKVMQTIGNGYENENLDKQVAGQSVRKPN